MPDIKPKPCPFCGNAARTRHHSLEGTWSVECGHCTAALPFVGLTEAEAITAWNTRSTDTLQARLEEAEKLVYIPGVWRCAKCNFRLVQSNLNAYDGGVTARDDPGEKCPNDGAPLWRVAYKDDVAEAYERWEEQVARAVAAESKLAAIQKAIIDDPNWICTGLPDEAIEAGEQAWAQARHDLENYVSGETADWDEGMIVAAIFKAVARSLTNIRTDTTGEG